MIFIYILLGIVLLITLILLTSVRIKIEFSDELKLKFYFGIIKIPEKLLNTDKRKKSKKSKSKKQKKDKNKANIKTDKKKNKYFEIIKKKGYHDSLVEVLEFLGPVFSTLESFASKIRINPFIIKIKMVNDDAAELAIDYGKFCSVYYPLVNILCEKTNCKNVVSDIFVDYVSKKSEIYIKTTVKVRLIHAFTHLTKLIKEFLRFKSKFN